MDFSTAIERTRQQLLHNSRVVDTGHWQGVTTGGKPDLVTKELLDVYFTVEMPQYKDQESQPIFVLRDEIKPNLPWADLHFAERVSRDPSNPGKAYQAWPWWRGQTDTTHAAIVGQEPGDFKFTHTYQERYWPKRAGFDLGGDPPEAYSGLRGIRYPYGDLDDLITLLSRHPHTRQAWLPIFFPEDTGAVHGGRVPCTLGYQFMLRNSKLHMWYIIRSCDFIRHFRDDLYLSAKLLLWVLIEVTQENASWSQVTPGNFHFHCFSMHYHRGDEHLLRD